MRASSDVCRRRGPFAFTLRSSRDVEKACRWYETERTGLGAEFRDEL